jgi:hypothetical protein
MPEHPPTTGVAGPISDENSTTALDVVMTLAKQGRLTTLRAVPSFVVTTDYVDDGRPKPMPELLPARGVLAVASVMAAGHDEHGDRWRTHTPIHHVGAVGRHVLRWIAGETYDHDLYAQGHGKHSHLACAAARALMALDLEQPDTGETR